MKHLIWLTLTLVLFMFKTNLSLSQPYPNCPAFSFYHTTCPLVSWNFVENATAYKVMFSKYTDFSILTVNAITENNYYQVENLELGEVYHVKVVPGNKQMGWGNYCPFMTFMVIQDCPIRP